LALGAAGLPPRPDAAAPDASPPRLLISLMLLNVFDAFSFAIFNKMYVDLRFVQYRMKVLFDIVYD
jgi:hypothetical protein